MADILPPSPIGTPFGSYAWEDWYRKVRDAINNASSINWNIITNKPNTVTGYGIIDGVYIAGAGYVTWTQAVADGTAGNTATLTNAPIAGNPTKWIAIDDNGTVRYIPAW